MLITEFFLFTEILNTVDKLGSYGGEQFDEL
jgi:hypothetical protein